MNANFDVKRIANREAREYVEQLVPFIGHNLAGLYQDNGIYVVLSYGYYPILAYASGMWFGNRDKYSVTTSRHLSQSMPKGVEIQWLSLEVIKRLIRDGYEALVTDRLLGRW